MKLLLASTSTLHGGTYLDYLKSSIRKLFSGCSRLVFVPYARPGGRSASEYSEMAEARFKEFGLELRGLEQFEDPIRAIESADGVFTGGGNSFVLLKTLQEAGLLEPLRNRIRQGCPYMGSSAGSNLAGLTIGTTNDMPIVHPKHLDALGLVPFNINPHYLDPDPNSHHMGETRETRIREFHVFNPQPVLGLRESSWLEVDDERIELHGPLNARLFVRGQEPVECPAGLLALPRF
ncbi:dipeptidase PepE [bacterium]|nr:dipeptidase PepE [bacterium]